jgi:hypothetical protein
VGYTPPSEPFKILLLVSVFIPYNTYN